MKNVVQFPDDSALKTAAAQWLVKLDRGPLSAQDREALGNWLGQGPEHKAVLLKMAGLWGEMDVAKILAELFPLPEEARQQSRDSLVRKDARARKPLKMLTAAALVAIAVAVGFVAVQNPFDRDAGSAQEIVENLYTTRLGEHTAIQLADGSRMNLNTQSRARVRFSDSERAIYLEQGEGYFDVAKNPEWPFVVYAGSGMVRAVGTAFSVRVSDSSAVDVTLAEGVVEVIADGDFSVQQKTADVMVLSKKGETVSYRQSIDELILIPEDKLEQRLAWKSGKWLFKGETLAQVVAEASRYTETEIRITDPAIENLQVAGYFDLGELEPLLEALEAGLGVAVTRRSEGAIELSARQGPDGVIR